MLDCWVLSNAFNYDKTILPRSLARPIRKVGDYYAAAEKIIIAFYPYMQAGNTNLEIEEVRGAEPMGIKMTASTLKLFNERSLLLHNLNVTSSNQDLSGSD